MLLLVWAHPEHLDAAAPTGFGAIQDHGDEGQMLNHTQPP
jgi:hypothetical protein